MSGIVNQTTSSAGNGLTNAIGSIAGIYEKGKSAANYEKAGNASLQQFLSKLTKYGTIVKARYEVSFSGIENLTFFITDINVPSIRRNFSNLHYYGQTVEIPTVIEYEHDFSMTIINDGKGILYSTIANWLMTVEGDSLIDSGYTMTLRMLGDGVNTHGLTIVFEGVRFKSIGGLSVSSTDSGISTFNLNCSAIRYSVMAGELTQIGLIAGAVNDATKLLTNFINSSGN